MRWPWSEPGADEALPPLTEIALFPLKTPLLPGGRLSLKVFEPRYLDLMAACMRSGETFGICLIDHGEEVANSEPVVPHSVGTLARIDQLDMDEADLMHVQVRGEQRFRIVERRTEADGLQCAMIRLLTDTPHALPKNFAPLLPLLKQVLADLGEARMPPPHYLDDAIWVGHRLVEVLPVQPLAKQKLLELDDPIARLEIVLTYLRQRGLVK